MEESHGTASALSKSAHVHLLEDEHPLEVEQGHEAHPRQQQLLQLNSPLHRVCVLQCFHVCGNSSETGHPPDVLGDAHGVADVLVGVEESAGEVDVIVSLNVDEDDEGPYADGFYQEATLGCVPPHLELETMTPNRIQVTWLVEPEAYFLVKRTVIIVP